MRSKAKPPTKAEKRRMSRVVEIGCVFCLKDGRPSMRPVSIHHLGEDGMVGKRRGHAFTVGACHWHHYGHPVPPINNSLSMTKLFGPSVAHGSRPMADWYGHDDEVLAFQNRLLESTFRS